MSISSEFYSEEQKDAWQRTSFPQAWTTRVLELEVAVAHGPSNLLGFVSWQGNEIVHLYADPEVRGYAIGTQLLEFARNAIDAPSIVLTSSLNALDFYQRHGFVEVGREIKVRFDVALPCIQMIWCRV